jgi:hypothetical protein
MRERVRFDVVLQPEGSSTFIVVPDEIGQRIGVRGRTSVVGTLNGHLFQNQVMPYKIDGRTRLLMVVNNAVRKAAGGLQAGDRVTFELERDELSRSAVIDVPVELQASLDAAPDVAAVWARLPPSHRREHAESVAAAKRPDTRARRVAQVLDRLRQR